jgi:SHS2 domain-containing protein
VFLEHTADVGIDVVAGDLAGLFRTAARGMFALLMGSESAEHDEGIARADASQDIRHVRLRAMDPAALLVDWLRELLFLHETEDLCIADIEFAEITEAALDATVRWVPCPGDPVREIKGVTYHQLGVEHRDHEWYGRVIFDV